jgi:MFS family permease
MPLSLTILTAAFPARRRGMIVGIYGGLAGLAGAAAPSRERWPAGGTPKAADPSITPR